ncbi:odorant receptor 13a-like [Diachasmimorpha longicaudata]|uniref:odorant receptor 13a-like n=1 Tax=Diachasmimorpha longicaudata TaxID=58733 RepID=UPI0030B8EF17
MSKQLSKGSIAPPLQFEYYFGGDVLILQSLGLYSMGSLFKNTEPSFKLWELPPFICGIGILLCGLTGDFYNVILETRQYSLYAIEVLAIVFCGSLGTFKGYRLWIYRREFYNFIKAIQLRWDEEVAENTITERMVEDAKSMRLFRTWYGTVVAAIFGSYIIRPCLAYCQFKLSGGNDTFDFTQTVYPAVHPFPLTTPQSFFCCVVVESVGVIFCTLYWTAADGLFAQLTTQLAIQFEILANRLRYMPTPEMIGSHHTAMVVQRLKKTVQDYLKLFEYINELETIYNPILFSTVLVNGLNICTCLYSLQYRLSKHEWGMAGKNAILTTGITAQTMMFCMCAQRLNDEVAGVRQAAYNCSWTEFDSTIKNLLLLIMIQTEPEFIYAAYGFVYLNKPQMTVIFTAAMRFFTLLRNMT